jgi:hypothetical protein
MAARKRTGNGLGYPVHAHAATPPAGPLRGTLDSQTGTAAAEDKAGVTMAMFEFSRASFERAKGQYSASYLATMRSPVR